MAGARKTKKQKSPKPNRPATTDIPSGPGALNSLKMNKPTSQPTIEPPEFPYDFHIPPEILSKIHGYITSDKDYKTGALIVCNLALVCQSFYDFFATQKVFNEVKGFDTSSYVLVQHSVKRNIWDLDSLNNWYSDTNFSETFFLPTEIWTHQELFGLVLEHLKISCAPSREDLSPYANDQLFARQFIEKIPHSDFFAYLGEEVRGNKSLVLDVVKKHPNAIKHCTTTLLNDRDFIKEVVDTNGSCLKSLGDYRSDSELVILASRTNTEVLNYAKGAALNDITRIYGHKNENCETVLKKSYPDPDYCYSCGAEWYH